ncbi:hypothetical protein CLOM_g12896 [Closterium sp. NIES-68]|nr:hypothetical protein CLOM_g12896 [Closterium sp. NIES-68]GJP83149.1 hypothetical protein CLOP_g13344 [Closterium sp. NIES-67]
MENPGNLAGPPANEAVTRGISPEKWTVRESLKYVWDISSSKDGRGCGRWMSFSVARFCQALGGKKLLVTGDSLNGQLALSLLLRLKIDQDVILDPGFSTKCIAARLAYPHLPVICFSSPICESSGHPSQLYFIRSDYLDIPVAIPGFSSENHWWVDEIAAQGVDMVVLNRGAHYVEDAAFEAQLNATFHHLRNRFPGLLLIVRSSAAGHADCMNYSRPIEKRLPEEGLPHNWGEISHQNRIAERLAHSIGAAFLDVDEMTALRPDSHMGRKGNSPDAVDCLHYCIPGPQDGWSDMLLNMLLDLLP